jgi:hypothetical protein
MERFHDRPFQDFVAHETRRLIPRAISSESSQPRVLRVRRT